MRKATRLVTATAGWIIAATCMAPHGDSMPGGEDGGLLGPSVAFASGVAQVRFVNELRGVDEVMVDADDHLAFAGVEYRGGTSYAEVGANGSRFVLRTADGRALATYEGELDQDVRYCLIATRDASGDPMLSVVRDPVIANAAPREHDDSVSTARAQSMYQQVRY